MTTRPAAVAGMFYPALPKELATDVGAMLASAGVRETRRAPKALIVPHAGYVYSGPIAASAYRLLVQSDRTISRVVLIGPAHREQVDGIAVPTSTEFETPLGSVPIDTAAIADIEKAFAWVVRSDAAHRLEHCLEVQLPFLQTVLERFSLVPLLVGRCDSGRVREVLDALWGGDETLVVVSSDLSHYLSYGEAVAVDAQTDRAIVARSHRLRGDQACGAYAINGLMRGAEARGLDVTRLDLRNSGDTAGDRTQVVGYGSYALY